MNLSDRMKVYEGMETNRILMPHLPALVRLDGRCFHSFTRGMERPFDQDLSNAMIGTTEYIAKETNASMGYTQSDEISLVLLAKTPESSIFFDGSIFKLTSILAAMVSVYFNKFDFGGDDMPVFDCRVWNVPTREEAANYFLWREQDATRNSIQMAAQSVYSQKQLMNKNTSEMQEMLFQKGINWNDYPDFFKRGTYIQRHTVLRQFTPAELAVLPDKHAARTDPDLQVERTEFRQLAMPPFIKVTNRVQVVFEGADPN